MPSLWGVIEFSVSRPLRRSSSVSKSAMARLRPLSGSMSIMKPKREAAFAPTLLEHAGGPRLDGQIIDGVLADAVERGAARQRNVLVHLYLDVGDREIFASLGRLDDLRAFAAVAQRLVDET